jgi:hypothetical protein
VLSLELSLNVFHGKLWQLAGHDIDLGREAKAKIDPNAFGVDKAASKFVYVSHA